MGAVKRIPTKLRWTIFRKRDILYVCELSRLDSQSGVLPENVFVEKRGSVEQIEDDELKAICGDQNRGIFTEQLKDRFSKNSVVWLIKYEGKTAGMFWTITGTTIEPHYFCLTENDAHLYNGEILSGFRGRGLFSSLANYILYQLKKEGFSRVYIETNLANTAAIRAFERIHAQRIGTARKYRIFGRNITIWNKEDHTA